MKRNQFTKEIKMSVKFFSQFDTRKMSKVERKEFERELTKLRNLYIDTCSDFWKRWNAYYK